MSKQTSEQTMTEEKVKIWGIISDGYEDDDGDIIEDFNLKINSTTTPVDAKTNLLENLKGCSEDASCNFTIKTDTKTYEYDGPCDRFVQLLKSDSFF